MQPNINVDFKFEVFDERIKKKAVEVIAQFSGVASTDWKENGKLKVKGKFDSHVMTTKFKKICTHVSIVKLITEQEPEQNGVTVTSRESKPEQNRAMVMYKPRPEQNQASVTSRESKPEQNRARVTRWPEPRPNHRSPGV